MNVQPTAHRKDSFEEEIDKIDRKNSLKNVAIHDETPKVSINHDNKAPSSINVH